MANRLSHLFAEEYECKPTVRRRISRRPPRWAGKVVVLAMFVLPAVLLLAMIVYAWFYGAR